MILTTNSELRKIPQTRALEIIERYQVEKELREQIDPGISPVELICQWLKEEMYNEVVTFLCHALPAREAVWWGCLCLQLVTDPSDNPLPQDQQQALDAAERWVREPTEANRRSAEARSKRAELDNAAGWLAQSAFWSGGSITPIDAPASPVPPYLYSHAVAGAVCLAAILPDGSKARENYKRMIGIGLDIADGGNGC
ncbi:hypothetical protein M3P05_16130 [Sansalvadorimonas sp. 2012CJ34-2]|uniref:Secreted protein n=1 Tax=Parendozoicomonas callyspongiae TaxID=2942213 RepID=A0ABT0PJ89_9GAMM|nr:hypothetical protein [Sansalvadorimonas sp. 2012CJ34-2]MCL6271450.1 hypothetical protein [Sansalvadorimonas sp. 2012CJ34-2]